ncbi:hypothetical protein KDH_12420 [Dictyobacter sp. S3.2.2.5]|uniref:Helix-turn-helix domain-containing protein n=1 Tax=Dictyobacter halimunensis TaxID=3026934 RepID=A0ABQ6FLC5_9CHLR|nr:hypothetical protein KDH_12420 [Dictyobacter sp. S3.2.2.5]
MAENDNKLTIPGYVSTSEAAKMLGVSNHRMYQYVKANRLPVVRVGRAFMLRVEDVERFRPNPSGRMRKKAPAWRGYRSRGKVLITDIVVPVLSHQQQAVVDKLMAIQQTNQHTFPGTIARYIIKGDDELTSIHMLLIWKDIEMPDQKIRQQHLLAFQEEFTNLLDWKRAQYTTNESIIHT